MMQAIQAMYADVPVCVRTSEGLSGCFQSLLGVKQGCPLSPLLFGIFLDDWEGHLQAAAGSAAALPTLAGRTADVAGIDGSGTAQPADSNSHMRRTHPMPPRHPSCSHACPSLSPSPFRPQQICLLPAMHPWRPAASSPRSPSA